VWSHDGQWVAYTAERAGSTQIYRIQANGAGQEQQLTDGPNPKAPRDWSQDGRFLIYSETHPQSGSDLWILPLDTANGRPGKPIPFLTTPANETFARFSPDGRWIAYTSTTTGRAEAFVRAFPGGPPGEWPVSNDGAGELAWRADGNELFYRSFSLGGAGGSVTATAIRFFPGRLEVGASQVLFSNNFGGVLMPANDGQRFLVFGRVGETATERSANPLTLVLNWQAALK
jgi:Tol biopolymer transport system component